jgi:hypothetical protein
VVVRRPLHPLIVFNSLVSEEDSFVFSHYMRFRWNLIVLLTTPILGVLHSNGCLGMVLRDAPLMLLKLNFKDLLSCRQRGVLQLVDSSSWNVLDTFLGRGGTNQHGVCSLSEGRFVHDWGHL